MRCHRSSLYLVAALLVLTVRSFAQYIDLFPIASLVDFPKRTIPFTIEVDVYNDAGPGVATDVVVTHTLPEGLTFVSCTVANYVRRHLTTDGTLPYAIGLGSTNYGNIVRCDAGRIPYGYFRPIFITLVASEPGIYNNQFTVAGQGGTDAAPWNNNLTFPVQVHSNGLDVLGGQSAAENSGSNVTFIVRLAPVQSSTVTVDFSTADRTGKSGEDFQPVSGTLVFPPGVTNQTVSVPVLDDSLAEAPSQSFTLRLTNAVNAELSGMAESNYVLDNEPPLLISIRDAAPIFEGDGFTNVVFPIELSSPTDNPTFVLYTATGGVSATGVLTNPAGVTNYSLVLPVVGNLNIESNRPVEATLSTPWPIGGLGQSTAHGLILDEDGQPGNLHHIEIDSVPSPQLLGRPFSVTLYAKDAFNNPATNHVSDRVEVVGYRIVNFSSQIIAVDYVTNFVQGVGSATITYTDTASRASVVAWKPVGNGYTTASTPDFKVIAPPTLFVSVPTNAAEGDGVLVGAGRVSITNIDVQDVVVELSSSDELEIVVPPSVIIPAGQTSAVFNITIVDDSRLDGPHETSISAGSLGYLDASTAITIRDNESATLRLTLPTGLSEANGFHTGFATVFVSSSPDLPVWVNLTSSNPAKLVVPLRAYIQAGWTSETFAVFVPGNSIIDGPQEVTVTAHVPNWINGSATTVVQDDDTNITVNLNFGNDIATEGSGTRTNGLQVRLGGVTSNAVTVDLVSSHPNKVVVPPSVVVPAGQQTINTNFTLLDDVLFDGNTSVTVAATAPGFLSGARTFTVYDNDVHHITFGAVGTNQTSGVPFRVSFTVRDVNDAVMHFFRGSILLSAVRGGTALPMSPTSVSNSLVRGTWTGNVTINGWGTNVQLVATAPSGVTGLSNPFDIPAPPWVAGFRITGIDLLGPDVRLSFNSITGRTYQVEVSTNLNSAWYPIGAPLNGTGNELSVTNPVGLAEPIRFYRLSVAP